MRTGKDAENETLSIEIIRCRHSGLLQRSRSAVRCGYPPSTPDSTAESEIESPDILFQSIARQQPVPTTAEPLLQPPIDGELLPPVATPNAAVTLQELEQMALTSNPAVAQADARIRALRGRWVQAGLPPNPSAGYMASEIGNEGTRRSARWVRRAGVHYGR